MTKATEWGKRNMQGQRFPMNLQLFAEGEAPEGAGTGEGGEGVKTYTADEVTKLLQSEADKRVTQALKTAREQWEAQEEERRKEADRMAKLSKDEREREQFKKDREAFEKEREALERDRLELEVVKVLGEKGLDTSFSKFLMGKDADESMENIKAFQAAFDKAVEAGVKDKLGGRPPQTGATISGANPFDKEHFNLTEQGRLLKENPEKYRELKAQAGKSN